MSTTTTYNYPARVIPIGIGRGVRVHLQHGQYSLWARGHRGEFASGEPREEHIADFTFDPSDSLVLATFGAWEVAR